MKKKVYNRERLSSLIEARIQELKEEAPQGEELAYNNVEDYLETWEYKKPVEIYPSLIEDVISGVVWHQRERVYVPLITFEWMANCEEWEAELFHKLMSGRYCEEYITNHPKRPAILQSIEIVKDKVYTMYATEDDYLADRKFTIEDELERFILDEEEKLEMKEDFERKIDDHAIYLSDGPCFLFVVSISQHKQIGYAL